MIENVAWLKKLEWCLVLRRKNFRRWDYFLNGEPFPLGGSTGPRWKAACLDFDAQFFSKTKQDIFHPVPVLPPGRWWLPLVLIWYWATSATCSHKTINTFCTTHTLIMNMLCNEMMIQIHFHALGVKPTTFVLTFNARAFPTRWTTLP